MPSSFSDGTVSGEAMCSFRGIGTSSLSLWTFVSFGRGPAVCEVGIQRKSAQKGRRQAGEEGGGPAKRAAGRGRGQRAGEEDSRPGKKTASRGRRQRVGEKDSGPGKRTAGRGRRQQAGKEDSGPEGKGWTGDRGKARLKRKGLAQEVRRGPGKARRISFFLPAGLNEWQSGHPPY